MPNITVEILRGRALEQRHAFVEAVTAAAVTHLGALPDRTRIRISEVGENEVALGGEFVQPPGAR